MWELGTNCTLVKGLKQEFVVRSISNTCITGKICFFSQIYPKECLLKDMERILHS